MPKSLPNVVEFKLPDLAKAFAKIGVESYRARQLFDWIYGKGVYEFDEMTNFSNELAAKLTAHFRLDMGTVVDTQKSKHDKSVKVLLEFKSGGRVEAVSIPKKDRRTVCLSSQVGCKFRCSFCASGQAGFVRNLSSGEMIAQVLRIRDISDLPVTHVVFMGIGEPLDNYDNLVRTIHFLNDAEHFGIGARKITVSTCGVAPKIERLAREKVHVELSISLHGVDDDMRSKIMPVNRRYPIERILEASRNYTAHTKREVTFEYILAKGLNAGVQDAYQLARLLGPMRCKVNLIPLNPIPEFPYERPNRYESESFSDILNEKGIRSTIRFSSGTDITAACGQLRSIHTNASNSNPSP